MSDNIIQEYLKQGWKFEYEPATKFIAINHPSGGKRTLCEMANGYECGDFGKIIAKLLNEMKL